MPKILVLPITLTSTFLHIKKYSELYLLLILFISTSYLRFQNLGFSEYCVDEPGAFLFYGKETTGESVSEFLLKQRKGPMQFIVSYLPYLVTGDFQNELAERLPFAFFNIAAVILFYFVIKKLTGNKTTAFIAAFLFSFNGFIVAFGRVAQYQSLNLFFSLLAVYFYSALISPNEHHKIRKTMFGTLALSLSVLSHWDVVYFVPVILTIFIKFLLNREYPKSYKTRIVLYNFILGTLLLAPYLVLYISSYMGNTDNREYFSSRVSFSSSVEIERDLGRIVLYNPFLMVQVYAIFGFIGIIYDLLTLFIKKLRTPFSGVFTLWFVVVTLLFLFVIGYPGTHLYNFLIPLMILSSLGFYSVIKLFPKWAKVLPIIFCAGVLVFLFHQSERIFVDSVNEYPWQQETIYKYTTQEYSQKDGVVQRNLIGFPHYRKWKEINKFINEENARRETAIGYITNDHPTISQFYMDAQYTENVPIYYAIGIKEPYTFVTDYKFFGTKGKRTIYKIVVGDEYKSVIYIVGEAEK